MRSRWNDSEASKFEGPLNQRIYASRLLGADTDLVLHGGGNTSVKITETDLYGEPRDVLYVKGSGADLATITTAGFTPLNLSAVRRLARLDRLSDTDMVRELANARLDPAAPSPSIEAILHALIPQTFVDHTHADAFLSISNTPDGEQRIREIYGESVLVVPYVMPGFVLARLCARSLSGLSHPVTGIALLKHGVFSFGETARESYETMIGLVTKCEDYLQRHSAWHVAGAAMKNVPPVDATVIAQLRSDISAVADRPMIMHVVDTPHTRAFAGRDDVARISQQGTLTPDHVIRTKRAPLIGRNAQRFAEHYANYFRAYSSAGTTMLDPAPRIVLDPEFGMCATGSTARDTKINADIYLHTIDGILRSTALGEFAALNPEESFAIEYWELEQAKLRNNLASLPFTGEIALVTGAASGIGAACVSSLLERGAAVIALDIDDRVLTLHDRAEFLGIHCDVTDRNGIAAAIDSGVRQFGGIDIVVANAGVFPPAKRIAEMTAEDFRVSFKINTDSVVDLLAVAHPYLCLATRRGRVVIVGSRNVPAPGAGVAAYSASKAALTQLARVAALEWGKDRITVNVVHPHGVFDTAIWSGGVLEQRASQYGMTVDRYKANNVLGVELTSRDVGELIAELCGPVFAKITGAQIPIDGGNDRVI